MPFYLVFILFCLINNYIKVNRWGDFKPWGGFFFAVILGAKKTPVIITMHSHQSLIRKGIDRGPIDAPYRPLSIASLSFMLPVYLSH